MERKTQQLTFNLGITTMPSDAICPDNALEQELGMIYREGEHRVIQKPRQEKVFEMNNSAATLVYIHKFGDEDRYIFLQDKKLFYELDTQHALLTTKGKVNVMAVGKILIAADKNGLHYFLWKDDEEEAYKDLGTGIPEPNLEFTMSFDNRHQTDGSSYQIVEYDDFGRLRIVPDKQEDYNNLVIGLYSKYVNDEAKENRFTKPFVLRYALRMYDGTHTLVSMPIIMLPFITSSCVAKLIGDEERTYLNGISAVLKIKGSYDYAEWSDIIKGVDIFVSKGIDLYELTNDQNLVHPTSMLHYDGIHDGKLISEYTTSLNHDSGTFLPLNKREKSAIREDLTDAAVFYRIIELESVFSEESFVDCGKFIKDHVLENLTTQDQLEADDYFSRSPIVPKKVFSYNSRIVIADVTRSIFEGFEYFLPYDNETEGNYSAYVTIKTNSGAKVVRHDYSTKQKQGIYFYYPDARAKHVTIFKGNACVLDADLKEHRGLNGAYYFTEYYGYYQTPSQENTMDGKTMDEVVLATTPEAPDVSTDLTERLPNYVLQSDVNNPFVFPAKGYFTVGTGKILGMSSITQALSQGQFGQYPLLVFSESGIWSASLNNEGYFTAVHPMSREVCNNTQSITQTDGAVFFTTDKGLMVVVGSEVKCVSEQLDGKVNGFMTKTKTEGNSEVIVPVPFADYAKDCFVAYDYRDSLLWLFKKGETVCWVYSIKSGAFARYEFAQPIDNVVNNYPDYLLQSGNTIYSLLKRKNINKDDTAYEATIVTRPMKLENALALKTIIDMEHVCDLHKDVVAPVPGEDNQYTYDEGRIALSIQVSNDLKNWQSLSSLRGTPWKYYRFTYELTNLLATDAFAGTVLLTEERRTDKLR